MRRERELEPWAWLVPLRTPTLPPAATTNTLVVGGDRLVVIEPATPHAGEQRVLDELLDRLVAEGRRIEAIAVTHHHRDHVGCVEMLRDRWRAPVWAHAETARRVDFTVDRLLEDGDSVDLGDGVALEAVFTPGHAPGHLVFVEPRSKLAYAGDMVAGEGTILIDPHDDGDMAAYLTSLDRLEACGTQRLVPSHGPVLERPKAVLEHYVQHRLKRELKVLAAIGPNGTAVGDVLSGAYDDTPVHLWPLAARSLEAHLRKLEGEGRIARDGTRVCRIPLS
jgi:endoribonuclease LACTB2